MDINEMSDEELMGQWSALSLNSFVWHVIGILNTFLAAYAMTTKQLDLFAIILVGVAIYFVSRNSTLKDAIIHEAADREINKQ